MASLILFNKPYRVLSQFSDSQGRQTLADFLQAPEFRVAGRLDFDSEGLLLLTDDGLLQQKIANPKHRLWKTYLVQVEGLLGDRELAELRSGVMLKDGVTLPAKATRCEEPALWPRHPPIRSRKSVADSWLNISIREGKNRQIRRMTAAIGHPTLRLVRTGIGHWELGDLKPGEWRTDTVHTPRAQGISGRKSRRR